MKVTPKLSNTQLQMLEKYRPQLDLDRVSPRRAAVKAAAPAPAPKVVGRPKFAVADCVELARDVAGTAFKAGQKGTILALHGLPVKVAEVELAGSLYAEVVGLADLLGIG